jgi:hypothetical protein
MTGGLLGRFCASTVTCPREPISSSYLLYAHSGSSVVLHVNIVFMGNCVNIVFT